jgi:hypothetical protein
MVNGFANINKNVLIGIVAGVLIIVGGVVFTVLGSRNASPVEDTSTTTAAADVKLVPVRACELLTLDEAKSLLGSNASESGNTNAVTSGDISVDTCSYINNARAASDIRIVTILARSALTDVGLESNLGAFDSGGTAHPTDAKAISGYGDKAYWDPRTKQLAILQGNTWLSIVYGGTNPAKNTLDDAKRVAELVVR